jgi:hypothetical protein
VQCTSPASPPGASRQGRVEQDRAAQGTLWRCCGENPCAAGEEDSPCSRIAGRRKAIEGEIEPDQCQRAVRLQAAHGVIAGEMWAG